MKVSLLTEAYVLPTNIRVSLDYLQESSRLSYSCNDAWDAEIQHNKTLE